MNEQIYNVLEYQKIIRMLSNNALSESGKALCEKLAATNDYDEIKTGLQRTADAVAVLLTAASIPLTNFTDVTAVALRAELGAVLEPYSLLQTAYTLNLARRMKNFLAALEHKSDWLEDIFLQIVTQKHIEEAIIKSIDENGTIRDTASNELGKIRKEIRVLRMRVKERIEAIARSPENQKYLSDSVVMMRNDRYVIPVKQECRQQFSGIVHDTSGSGATVFIEPMAIVNINNDLRQLESKEKHEIERILAKLSEEVGRFAQVFSDDCRILAELDFVFAKGKLALQMNATFPELNFDMSYRLKNARHPLIDSRDVVAVNIVFGEPYRLLLITGPNTGGKTVTLKTLGLFTLMAQSGLFIPADSGSSLPCYNNLFVDIGDEQSIAQNLSTFSGHMKNIIRIIKSASRNDLVLFDEIGAGTDPEEGAALAQAVLEQLITCDCMTAATTHYGALKSFGYNHGSVMNASVEFDVNTLSPTYRLLIGTPGSSNAFAISRKLGLSEEIIGRAGALVSGAHTVVESMLGKIDADLREANSKLEEARLTRDAAIKMKTDIDDHFRQIEIKRGEIIEKAKREASETIRRARAETEYVIGQLKKIQANDLDKKQNEINDLRKTLSSSQQQLEDNEQDKIQYDAVEGIIAAGSNVYIDSLKQAGVVVSISGNTAVVQIGVLKTNLSLNKLKLIKNRSEARKYSVNRSSGSTSIRETRRELDIRGMQVADALPQIDKFIDDGVMSGLTRLVLIHGKGTGLLRQGVREHLRQHPNVKSIEIAGYNEGGDGATLITLL